MIQIGQGIIAISVILIMLPLRDTALGIGLFFTGVGCAPVYPCMIHQTPKNFGNELSQAMIGIQMACAYIGTTFMPPLFGVMAENISISLYPYFMMVSLVFMIIMTEGLRRTARKEAKKIR
jgi:fucose permease